MAGSGRLQLHNGKSIEQKDGEKRRERLRKVYMGETPEEKTANFERTTRSRP